MHWFSIFNSFMIVAFLAGLVAIIMIRTLKMDYLRYSRSIAEIGTAGNADDYGWKRVHGDVFRPCPYFCPSSTSFARLTIWDVLAHMSPNS